MYLHFGSGTDVGNCSDQEGENLPHLAPSSFKLQVPSLGFYIDLVYRRASAERVLSP